MRRTLDAIIKAPPSYCALAPPIVLAKNSMSHSHCDSCVLISCNGTADTCPVEVCPKGCKTSLHRCKTEEHVLHTCPASYVPCINSGFGCEALLPRAKLGSHLKHCPASVVQCRFSYDRTASDAPSVVPEESDLLVDEESLLADGTLAQQDGRLLDSSGERAAQLPQFSIDCDPGDDLINPSSKSTARKLTLSPRTRVCIAATVTQYNYNSNPTEKHYFCFPCNEIVRRDEFSSHWRDGHLRVQTNMSTIIKRCPMRVFGCTHRQIHMAPNPSGASLRYLQGADCIAVKLPEYKEGEYSSEAVPGVYAQHIQKKQELAHYGYGEEEESYDVLSQLPVEILMEVCSHLDSLGLWNLSLVNHHIRRVCFNLVKKKGTVYHTWQRNKDTNKWEQGEKHWSFSRVFEDIGSWSFTDSPALCSHVMSCPLLHSLSKRYDHSTRWDVCSMFREGSSSVKTRTTSSCRSH